MIEGMVGARCGDVEYRTIAFAGERPEEVLDAFENAIKYLQSFTTHLVWRKPPILGHNTEDGVWRDAEGNITDESGRKPAYYSIYARVGAVPPIPDDVWESVPDKQEGESMPRVQGVWAPAINGTTVGKG